MTENAILLSIKPAFADKILSGEKRFEFRKSVPREKIKRVYLYVSGGSGIVGCFDVGDIITAPLGELWDKTGSLGTTKERFDKYFMGRDRGSAIEVKDYTRFKTPLFPQEIKKAERRFVAPQGFLYIKNYGKLGRLLNDYLAQESADLPISIKKLSRPNSSKYIEVVTKEIGSRYGEISSKFAENIVNIHFDGTDSFGVNTHQKEVFEIYRGKILIGFTTLTHKYGYSTKSGPSILFKKYRSLGYGLMMRSLIDEHCRSIGRGKLYCTCPADDLKLARHLMQSGFNIEGFLAAHYQADRGEIVMGKQLDHSLIPAKTIEFTCQKKFSVAEISATKRKNKSLTRYFDEFSERYWSVGRCVIRDQLNVIASGDLNNGKYEEKGVVILEAKSKIAEIVGRCYLMPKRGGALKLIFFSESGNRESFVHALDLIERIALQNGRRKVYSIIPFNHPSLIDLYRISGYFCECLFRMAYSNGTDAAVMSKFV